VQHAQPGANVGSAPGGTNNGTITFTRYIGTDANFGIPSTIDGLPVTSIGTNAFQDAPISAVSVPSRVTNIGDYAFSGQPDQRSGR
jgi:hypothetical protein